MQHRLKSNQTHKETNTLKQKIKQYITEITHKYMMYWNYQAKTTKKSKTTKNNCAYYVEIIKDQYLSLRQKLKTIFFKLKEKQVKVWNWNT